jgi:predicted O-methyltransferase YrrM
VLPFSRDPILPCVVDDLLDAGVTGVFETGTWYGYTIRHLAAKHPHLPMTTIESQYAMYRAARTQLQKFSNIRQVNGDSSIILPELARRGEFGGVPFFFLDAHWYELPLFTEVQCVARESANAVLLIHDFEVPGRPEFGFDRYGEKIVGLDILRRGLGQRAASIYLPNADYVAQYHRSYSLTGPKRMRGVALVFLGADAVHGHFLASEYVRLFTRV